VELTRAKMREEWNQRWNFGGISRVGYYPLAEYSDVHAAADAALGGGAAFARELGSKATEIDTRGVLRFVLGVTSASLLLRYADKVWSSYARGATVVVENRAPEGYDIEFQNMTGASELVFAEIEGSIEMLLARTGARVEVTRRRLGNAPASARYFVSWKE